MENHAENMHQKLVTDLPFYVNNPKHPITCKKLF